MYIFSPKLAIQILLSEKRFCRQIKCNNKNIVCPSYLKSSDCLLTDLEGLEMLPLQSSCLRIKETLKDQGEPTLVKNWNVCCKKELHTLVY